MVRSPVSASEPEGAINEASLKALSSVTSISIRLLPVLCESTLGPLARPVILSALPRMT